MNLHSLCTTFFLPRAKQLRLPLYRIFYQTQRMRWWSWRRDPPLYSRFLSVTESCSLLNTALRVKFALSLPPIYQIWMSKEQPHSSWTHVVYRLSFSITERQSLLMFRCLVNSYTCKKCCVLCNIKVSLLWKPVYKVLTISELLI